MKSITVKAFGKLNLTLDVLGKRTDGYHDMQMIMQSVDICDLLTVSQSDDDAWSCICDNHAIPSGMDNLALKAAHAFCDRLGKRPSGLSISIEKHIPVQGGMAGGSADAAAVLRAMNELEGRPFSPEQLAEIGSAVGSDVPYCVLGGTALAEGRGECLTKLPPMPPCRYVLVKPEFSVSTPDLFRELDSYVIGQRPATKQAVQYLEQQDLRGFSKCVYNVFQPVLEKEHPVIKDICQKLVACGALSACLTGTGSVVFGIFDDLKKAELAKEQFASHYFTFLAQNA